MTTPLTTIKAKLQALEEKRQELLKEIQTEFPGMFKEFFTKAPKLKSFGWSQFTPYFNDGDTCEFSAHTDYLFLNGCIEDDMEELGFDICPYVYKTIETEDDIVTNNKLADVMGYSWHKNKKIGEEGLAPNPIYCAETEVVVDEIKKTLKQIPDEFFKDLFGDHVKVTIHIDGTVDVEGYEHD